MPYPQRDDDGYVAPLTPKPGHTCQCKHTYEQHHDGTGPCTQPDSYGIPCTCPATEVYPPHWEDEDEDDDGEE